MLGTIFKFYLKTCIYFVNRCTLHVWKWFSLVNRVLSGVLVKLNKMKLNLHTRMVKFHAILKTLQYTHFYGCAKFKASIKGHQKLIILIWISNFTSAATSDFLFRPSLAFQSRTDFLTSGPSGSTNLKAVILVPPYLNSSKSTPCKSCKNLW